MKKKFLVFFAIILFSASVAFPQDSARVAGETLRLRISELERRYGEFEAVHRQFENALDGFLFIPNEVYFCGERVPIERPDVRGRIREALRIRIGTRPMRERMQSVFELGEYYFPILDSAFSARNLCADFRYLPVIESEFNLLARSWAGAVGPNQIITSTGRRCRLLMSRVIDERRNFLRSLSCAVRHLEASEANFGNGAWSAAAYNDGDPDIRRAQRENGSVSFFDAALFKRNGTRNRETSDYVYNAIAAKLIIENPEAYGFPDNILARYNLQNVQFEAPRQGVTVHEAARIFGILPAEFVFWNPEFATRTIPRGRYILTIPRS